MRNWNFIKFASTDIGPFQTRFIKNRM